MDPREKEARRMIAAELFGQGELRDSQIAALLEVSTRAVNKWHKAFREGGRQALRSSGPPGVPGLLDAWQCLQLRQVLRRGAKAYGFATDNWTLKRVRRVIAERFGVTYATLSGVWRLLRRIGYSPQRPSRVAAERDDTEIIEWVEQTWPQIQKKGTSAGPGSASVTNREPG
jgi:transposase